MSTTRRRFLAGAAVAPALARVPIAQAPAAAPAVWRKTVRRGRAIAVSPRGDRIVVAHDRRRTIAIRSRAGTRILDLGGMPVGVAVSPDGRTAAVTTGFWDGPGLALVDLAGGKVLRRLDVGAAPGEVAFLADGRHLAVIGGEQEGWLAVVDARAARVRHRHAVGLVPRGLAPLADARQAWVALNAESRVVRMDLAGGRIPQSIRTARLPDRIALSPDGRRLLVTHGGRRATEVSELDTRTGRLTRHHAGRLPSGVAWTPGGKRLVALGGEGAVIVLGGARHETGGAPRGLAVAGRYAWTADDLTDAIRRVRP